MLAQKLAPQGINICEARVVADDEGEIIGAVRDLSLKYTYVFTSGGIGPTHDDITAACIAKAFDTELWEDPEARAALLMHYGEADLTAARLKMAQVPRGARLIDNPVSKAPGFWIENVLVMAGVPKIFAGLVDQALPFLAGGQPTLSQTLVTGAPESMIAELMAGVEAAFDGLSVGSYPFMRAGTPGTSIVLRTMVLADVEAAALQMAEGLRAQGYTFEDQGVSNPAELG